MSAKTDEILESLKSLSLLEASELVKQIEEAFGVSAAASAGVVMAAPGAAGGGGEAAEEKTEFDVILEGFDASAKIKVLKAVRSFQNEFKKSETKGALFEGKLLSQDEIKAIADLPSREELMAQIAGAINAVATKVAVGINEVPTGMARALKQHAEGGDS